MNYTKEQSWELSLLALCIWREARNQPYQGKIGVAWSVKNRMLTNNWMGKTWTEVILHKWQYSSFNQGDPNASLLPAMDDPSFVTSLSVADGVYSGTLGDPTSGATHYFADSMKTAPAWVQGPPQAEFKLKIGDHSFYRAS